MKEASIIVVVVLIIAIFGSVIYAIHSGQGVKTAMKWFGLSFTFETQKREENTIRK